MFGGRPDGEETSATGNIFACRGGTRVRKESFKLGVKNELGVSSRHKYGDGTKNRSVEPNLEEKRRGEGGGGIYVRSWGVSGGKR